MPTRRTRKDTTPASLVLNVHELTWVAAASQFQGLVDVVADPAEPTEYTQYRKTLERRAEKGDVKAMAELIRLTPRYLGTPFVVETIVVLRSSAARARTFKERAHASACLTLLAQSLRPDLRGKRPYPREVDVAETYGELLEVYQAARRRERVEPIELCLDDYLSDQTAFPAGVEKEMTAWRIGKVWYPLRRYWFRIPKADHYRLKEGERPSVLALEKVADIFNLGKGDPSEAVDWTWKLVQRGRRRQREK